MPENVAGRARLAVQRMIDLPPPVTPARYDLVKARHQCRGVEADGTVTVTCEVTETTAGRYPPEVFTLTRSSPTLLTGTLRESGGSDLEGLEALKVR